jgi:hypothetical protein
MGLVGTDWEQRAVAELDSAMNEFLGALPDHREQFFLLEGCFADGLSSMGSRSKWCLFRSICRPPYNVLLTSDNGQCSLSLFNIPNDFTLDSQAIHS